MNLTMNTDFFPGIKPKSEYRLSKVTPLDSSSLTPFLPEIQARKMKQVRLVDYYLSFVTIEIQSKSFRKEYRTMNSLRAHSKSMIKILY